MLGSALVGRIASLGHMALSTGRDVDVTDPHALSDFLDRFRPSHIVLCAAHTGVDACENEIEQATRLNAVAPALVAELARARDIHATLVSTDYVFAGDGTRPYREDDPTQPLSVYGHTKLAGELAFVANGGKAIVRTSWLYGPNGKCFPKTMLKLMAERDSLRVVADQRGRPTLTADLADALFDVADQRLTGTFHFANAGETTWHAFAEAICAGAMARGMPIRATRIEAITTADYPTPARRPSYSVLDTTKIEAVLGVAPRPWQDALGAYLDGAKAGAT
jgi:dTDP-4-dehydrorhamnose reductase